MDARFFCLVLSCLLFAGCLDDPENINATLNCPVTASVGEELEISVTIENTAETSQRLVRIDISDSYLEGIVIQSSDPAYVWGSHASLAGMMSYGYDLEIGPGEAVEVRFSAVPVRIGDFSGNMDICINSDYDYVTYPVRTVVSA